MEPKEIRPRVPEACELGLPGDAQPLQVNHCRQPDCANFGVPARTAPSKTGPSADRDMNYKVHSTAKGKIPSIKCKRCGENPPMKSNQGIAEEALRLADAAGLWRLDERRGCGTPGCVNHARPIGLHPGLYRKRGRAMGSGGQYWQCRSCGRKTLLSRPTRLHESSRALAVDVFTRIANKSPVRGTARGAGLRSADSYYAVLDFIHQRCRERSGAADRAMIDGRLRLPRDMNLESDSQEYTLNWVSRLDRRNVVLSAHCVVDADSRFILGLHANFDGEADPFEVNAEAARIGDIGAPEPFRRFARYWLAGDELGAGRAMSRSVVDRQALLRQIQTLYAQAETRADVENVELQHHNETFRTPFMSGGLQVHLPYTAYAHWMILRRMLSGAGVGRLQASMDIDSMNRAGRLPLRIRRRGRARRRPRLLRPPRKIQDHRRAAAHARGKQARPPRLRPLPARGCAQGPG